MRSPKAASLPAMRFLLWLRTPKACSLWLRYDVLGTPLRDWLDFPEERRFRRARNNNRH